MMQGDRLKRGYADCLYAERQGKTTRGGNADANAGKGTRSDRYRDAPDFLKR
ncbi:hypothetical protein D3C72_2584340 [compost metagenome]